MASGLVVAIRRAVVAVMAGMLAALIIRVRGRGGIPPRTGGWRELRDDELEDRPDRGGADRGGA